MKKIVILILLLVSVIGCIEQKAQSPIVRSVPEKTNVPTNTDTEVNIPASNISASNDNISDNSQTNYKTNRVSASTNATVASITPGKKANSIPKANPKITVTPIISPKATQNIISNGTQNIISNDTEDNSSNDSILDQEINYDTTQPPDEGEQCYDSNGKDIPCPPDN